MTYYALVARLPAGVFAVKRLKKHSPVMDIEDLVMAGTQQRYVSVIDTLCRCH